MPMFEIVRDFAAEKHLGKPDRVIRQNQTLFCLWEGHPMYYGFRVSLADDIDLIERQLVQWKH